MKQKDIFLEWPSVQVLDYHTFLKMSVVICYDYKELCSHLLHVSAMATTQILYFVYLVSPAFVGYSQRKKEHVIRDYALPVVTTANKNCKVLWCIYLSLQDPLFGFNKLASQKFAHLNSSCLPYGSKPHLAKRIISSCPSDFHVQSYIWMFEGGVCWSAEGGSAEKCLFSISVLFYCFFFLFPRKFFCRRTQNKPKQNQKPWKPKSNNLRKMKGSGKVGEKYCFNLIKISQRKQSGWNSSSNEVQNTIFLVSSKYLIAINKINNLIKE